MGREPVINEAVVPRQRILFAVVLVCALLTGCENSCFIFVSNPSGGTLAVAAGNGTCHFTSQPVGNVRIRFTAPAGLAETWRERGIQHVLLSVREIDARLSIPYGEQSPGWRNLVPALKHRPRQIDLLSADARSSLTDSLGEAAAPSGEYSEIRILLTHDRPTPEQPVPHENVCANAGFNCAITEDGAIHPLTIPANDPLLIPSALSGSAAFRVFPNTTSGLDLAVDAGSSQFLHARFFCLDGRFLHDALWFLANQRNAVALPP